MMGRTEEKRAIRPLLYEDRILAVEQKFFCDRTTEKTVTLTVTDNGNDATVSNSQFSFRYDLTFFYKINYPFSRTTLCNVS